MVAKARTETPAQTRERFFSAVEADPNSGCWLWAAQCSPKGYGRFYVAPRVIVQAHRFAFEASVSPIPDGLELDHLCRTRCCVNPSHLEPVSPWENRRRGVSPPALFARQTVCVRGHPYSEANLLIDPRGHRRCRACKKIDHEIFRRNRRARRAKA